MDQAFVDRFTYLEVENAFTSDMTTLEARAVNTTLRRG